MSRLLPTIVAALLSAALAGQASAAPAPEKRKVVRPWKGHGFLPGYRTPQQIARERARGQARYVVYEVRRVGPYRIVEPARPWVGWPGYTRGRWSNGNVGPCWAQTPIGPVWTCGR